MNRLKKYLKLSLALITLLKGIIAMLINKSNYTPIYKFLKYFIEHRSYKQSIEILKKDPHMLQLLEERYHENYLVPWEYLKSLEPGTLGREFFNFMAKDNITPIHQLPEATVKINPEIDYLRKRIRLIHDIHHVLTGHPATDIGEMGISAFYVAQIRSPLNMILMAISFFICVVKYPEKMEELMDSITEGYLMGKKSKNIFGVRFELFWEKNIEELRQELQIIKPNQELFKPSFINALQN